jgi:elongation factor P
VISAGELKKGITIDLDGRLYGIVDYSHNKMGRGGAVVRLKLRDLRSGAIVERTFPASEKFRRSFLERSKVQFLYREDDTFYFMDTETFEQTPMTVEKLGDAANYLKENMVVDLLKHNEEALDIELPVTVDLAVTESEPGFKGDTATGGTKPALLETGLRVLVPLFVNVGDVVRVDTRTGEYLERA